MLRVDLQGEGFRFILRDGRAAHCRLPIFRNFEKQRNQVSATTIRGGTHFFHFLNFFASINFCKAKLNFIPIYNCSVLIQNLHTSGTRAKNKTSHHRIVGEIFTIKNDPSSFDFFCLARLAFLKKQYSLGEKNADKHTYTHTQRYKSDVGRHAQ